MSPTLNGFWFWFSLLTTWMFLQLLARRSGPEQTLQLWEAHVLGLHRAAGPGSALQLGSAGPHLPHHLQGGYQAHQVTTAPCWTL